MSPGRESERMPLTRRPATPADDDFVYALREAGYRALVEVLFGPWIEAQQREIQAKDMAEAPHEIVEEDEIAVGCIAVSTHADHDFLEDILIAPAHRNRGLGTRLMREVMATASARGVPLRLSVLDGNPVRSLYERLGFRVTAVVSPRTRMEWP
jgi:ribosomal protein S18 acetylase RimI-like enzyme